MQCYTELIPPSAVTHAVSLPFLNPHVDNLAVVKTSLLQLFRIHQSRLVLIAEYPLAGTVTSIAAIHNIATRCGGDALLIAFKDAKLSLLEWDPESHSISTISIHYYEGENVTEQPFGPGLREGESILTVDPSSRCAALKFGARSLAVLPFRQAGDELMDGGDDTFEPDMDVGAPSTLARTVSGPNTDQAVGETSQTPYKSSFVLPLTALDPALTHVVDITFLYAYREPTFGILSAPIQASAALLEERRDLLTYTVFTLDLEQRASTSLVSVQKLPADLWKAVSLPLPVGGALLIGNNEFIHVDQSGKANAVAVNEFAKTSSNFGMVDQSTLNLRLENCEIAALASSTGDLLVILGDGSFAVLTFGLIGRKVGRLHVSRVALEDGGRMLESSPSCAAVLGDNDLFVGSEDGDSSLVSCSRVSSHLSRKRSHAQMLASENVINDEESEEDLDDDDLYAPAQDSQPTTTTSAAALVDSTAPYRFEKIDSLRALAPFNDTCFGRHSSMTPGKVELVGAMGRGSCSCLTFLRRQIVAEVLSPTSFTNARNAWALKVRKAGAAVVDDFDNIFCVYDGEDTRIYDMTTSTDDRRDRVVYAERTDTDFETEGETLTVATMASGRSIVHCRQREIRRYDAPELSLSQIIPMVDEETDEELKIVHVSLCEPYILVLREDSSAVILKADESGEMEEVDAGTTLRGTKWLSGCLYRGDIFDGSTVALLFGEEVGLHIISLQNEREACAITTLPFLPTILSPEVAARRMGAKETLTEVLMADLGIEHFKQPYLIVRSALDDLTLYEPWRLGTESWTTSLRFRKVPMHYTPKFDENVAEESEGRPAPLRSIAVDGRNVVYVHGSEPTLIVKEPCSRPKALTLQSTGAGVDALIPLHHASCRDGFAVIESTGDIRECRLPDNSEYSSGWMAQRLVLGDPAQEVRHVAFHAEKQMYIVAACTNVDFYFPEEDARHQEQDDISLRPQIPRYTLYLLSATTRNVIHSLEMPSYDTVTSLKVMTLEVSEQTHIQKSMIVVGSAMQRGEDMPARGAVTVIDLLEVVPDPDVPESGCQLHVFAREETKGPVTAVEAFPGGFIGTGQGQKMMIRGLKEDGSCLPISFLDIQCYTTQLKSLGNTGMFLAGDAWKGVWFGGFTQEPYKLSVLGKSRTHMEVVAAEFLSFDSHLYILIIDARMDLHVMEYDPENPKSLSGTRLIHRSTMHLGHFASGMTLLPSSLAPTASQGLSNGRESLEESEGKLLSHVLVTTMSGAVGLITPVDEATYRRMGSIQTHLSSVLDHAAGLNPRAYRAVEGEGSGSRGIIDGSLVQRIHDLGAARRSEVLGRAGADAWALRSDLEIIGGEGLGYL